MSEVRTALEGASTSDGLVQIAEAPPQGMITLRGDLSDAAFADAIRGATGLDLPEARKTVAADNLRLNWMGPDELLMLCARAEAASRAATLGQAFATMHALAVDVSDARATFDVTGAHARDVLAKLCPVDLHPDVFSDGDVRRTRMAQVPAAFWLTGPETFRIVCFRSQARYVFDLLSVAAQPGSEVYHYTAQA